MFYIQQLVTVSLAVSNLETQELVTSHKTYVFKPPTLPSKGLSGIHSSTDLLEQLFK